MPSLRSLFSLSSRPVPRIRAVHDYTSQWDGHRVIRAATGDQAYVTGDDVRDGNRIVLDDGTFEVLDVVGHRHSDLYLCRLCRLP